MLCGVYSEAWTRGDGVWGGFKFSNNMCGRRYPTPGGNRLFRGVSQLVQGATHKIVGRSLPLVSSRATGMPYMKGRKAPRKGIRRADDTIQSRQQKGHLSELQMHWAGKCHLNAGASDLLFKYHVVSTV